MAFYYDLMNDTSLPKKLPDLVSGSITNGIEAENAWSTMVQCALRPSESDWRDGYFLSHECRKENLPFSSGELGGKNNIIMTDRPHEFLTYSHKGEFAELVSTEMALSQAVAEQYERQPAGPGFFFRPIHRKTWKSRVDCPLRAIQFHEVDDLVDQLNDGSIRVTDLFIHLTFTHNDQPHELCAPCRYVNFSNTKMQDNRYLQPITGYVLAPFEDFVISAYLAAAMNNDGSQILEFAPSRYINLFAGLVQAPGYGAEEKHILSQIGNTLPAYGKLYNLSIPIDGRATLYSYMPSGTP